MTPIAPFLWLALAAFVLAIPGFLMLFSREDPAGAWQPRRLHPIRRLIGLLLVLLAVAATLLTFTVYRYLQLFHDRPVAMIELHQEAPQRFRATVMGSSATGTRLELEHYTLLGDAWQMDARVLRWQLPAALAGVPSLYALDRISGRYDDVEQERSAERSVYALGESPVPDLFSLKKNFPRWLPFIDAQYGSATWMPMFDDARYIVLFNDRGGLLARPADLYTAEKLDEVGMGSAYRPGSDTWPAPEETGPSSGETGPLLQAMR